MLGFNLHDQTPKDHAMKTLEGPEPQIIQVRKIKPTLDHSIQKQLSLSLSLACQEIGGDDIDTLGNDDQKKNAKLQ